LFNIIRMFMGFSVIALAVLATAAPTFGQSTDKASYKVSQVKAAFIYNFVKFIEWPDEAWKSPAAPVRLCIWGNSALEGALEALRDKTAKNRKIQVLYAQNVQQVASCHVLFISEADPRTLGQIIGHTKKQHLLTVSDMEGFAARGGVIGLFLADNRMRFAINLGAARAAGLRISSQLLNLGKIVSTEEKQP
jgi:hypothetical protein